MATYKSTKGFTVQVLADDPTVEDAAGLLYFNTTDNEFKYVIPGGISSATWSSGGAMNTARGGAGSAVNGTQTAGLAFGGESPGGNQTITESYNGTSWTEVNDMNTARGIMGGSGTQALALAFAGNPGGGDTTDASEEFDGTSWAEGNNVNTARYGLKGSGIQTAALGFAGFASSARKVLTEKYDGTSWTEVNDLNTARTDPVGFGTTQSSSICAGGKFD